MSRLVYLYVSNGAADPDNIPRWGERATTADPFAFHFENEGFCYLFEMSLYRKVFDEILVVIESNRSPGHRILPNGIKILVVPHINELKPFLHDDDIMWARGGWRSWFSFLQEWHDQDRWLLFYRAASNRGAWTFWDIVLDDLIEEFSQDEHGRFYYPINKPINPELFYLTNEPRHYDIMIGASHIHDKKGQYRILPILIEYEKRYGVKLRCVMPGGMKHGVGTSAIPEMIVKHNLDVETPGMVSRQELHKMYCQSSLFVHCGGAGQNDRGPLEAMSCGTPVMLANEQYHAPFMRVGSFHIDPANIPLAVKQLNHALTMIYKDDKFYEKTYKYYQTNNGIEEVIYPQFSNLFKIITKTPHQQRQWLFDTLLETQESARQLCS